MMQTEIFCLPYSVASLTYGAIVTTQNLKSYDTRSPKNPRQMSRMQPPTKRPIYTMVAHLANCLQVVAHQSES